MSIFNTIKTLAFADAGAVLLQSTLVPYTFSRFVRKNALTAVWDLNALTLRAACPGILIGKAVDGGTFLTHYPPKVGKPEEGTIKGWNAKTGAEIPLNQIDPDSYGLAEKSVVFTDPQADHGLRIYDVLTDRLSKPFQFIAAGSSRERPDSWTISPDGRYLITTILGEGGGHDWMSGAVATIHNQGAVIAPGSRRYGFDISRFQTDALFNFSEPQKLFGIPDGNRSLAVYNLTNWRKVCSISIPNFENKVAFHPKNRRLMAVSTKIFTPDRQKLFRIELIEAADAAKGQSKTDAVVHAVLQESGWSQRLLFHPDGTHIASLIGGKVHWWNMEQKKRTAVFNPAET